MQSLTYTAYLTRRIIKYGGIGIVCLLILRFFWGITTAYLSQRYPPPPPAPTVPYGRLPLLSFPQQEIPQLSFKLETIEGTLPQLPISGKVFVISQPTANLLALDRTKELAAKLGFGGEPIKVSDRIYRFNGLKTPSTLEIDIITQKFKVSYDYLNDQAILAEKKLPNDEQATAESKSFLSQAGLLTPDLSSGQSKVSYYSLNLNELKPALSLSEADFVRVDLFNQDLDGLKVLPPNPNESLISFLFSGSREMTKRIVEVNYFPLNISQDNFGTYPLKTAQTAWDELQKGGGYIAMWGGDQGNKTVTIRRIYMAYFQPDSQANFLQPIIVFEGDPDFLAYVQAVDANWYQ